MSTRTTLSLLCGAGVIATLILLLRPQSHPRPDTRPAPAAYDAAPSVANRHEPTDGIPDLPALTPDVFTQLNDLLAQIRGLDGSNFKRARDLAHALALLLQAEPTAAPHAITAVTALDREGLWLPAAVVAVAIGQVPDRALAVQLADLLPTLTLSRARQEVVRALSQNRHGLEKPAGAWTASSALTDIYTPVVEQEVRAALIDLAQRSAASQSPTDRQTLAVVLEVLTFSQRDHPEVAAYLLELAEHTDPAIRREAIHALGFADYPAALDVLGRALLQENDAHDLGAIANGMIRVGGGASLPRVLDRLASEDLSPDARAALVQSLSLIPAADAAALSTVVDHAVRALTGNDNTEVQAAAINVAMNVRAKSPNNDRLLDALLQVSRDGEASMTNRVSAIASLWPSETERGRVSAFFHAVVSDSSSNVDLRRAALQQWVRTTTASRAPEVLDALNAIQSGSALGSLASDLDDAKEHLRRKTRK